MHVKHNFFEYNQKQDKTLRQDTHVCVNVKVNYLNTTT